MNVPRILGPAHPTRPRRARPVGDVANPVAFERSRRQLLREGLAGFGMLLAAPIVSGCGSRDIQFLSDVISNIPNLGSLQGPDANGLMLPPGFTSRVVARTNEPPVASSTYVWHRSPDGAAVFETSDGGWVYVSNAEVSGGRGGVGALQFAPDGHIVDAYPVLEGTSRNCAGGPTPWGTWLSCEETTSGEVYECDPLGLERSEVRPALGMFKHEAAAVDELTNIIYLTEDERDGCFYRFTPAGLRGDGRPDLTEGAMEVAEVVGGQTGPVVWHPLPFPTPHPNPFFDPTRKQVAASTPFNGGEGIYSFGDLLYFATKGDNRVWCYDMRNQEMTITYDAADFANPLLTGVDNVLISDAGDVLVAEDGGNLEIVAITAAGDVRPVVKIVGHNRSEVAGPAFDPSGTRLYFSSQRGQSGSSNGGMTFEVSGPWFI
ncbi:MAG: DUF839 domain-containing protein [Myxococcales bacterium]|nr:DUF839 domain-containing protein [Myxococcales bacterium]